jgi:hypothetical protein
VMPWNYLILELKRRYYHRRIVRVKASEARRSAFYFDDIDSYSSSLKIGFHFPHLKQFFILAEEEDLQSGD